MPIDGLVNSASDNGRLRWILSGQPDLYQDGHIYDWKVTSIWSANKEKPEWDQQVNLQAMLHRHNGDTVKAVTIIAILRDWQVSKSKLQSDYPQAAVKVLSWPLWSQEQAISFAEERMKLHQEAYFNYEKNRDVKRLPLCTDEERWYAGHKYAVKKKKTGIGGLVNKKADKVFVNKADAVQYISDNVPFLPKGKEYAPVEERPGRNIRCLSYCSVWKHCDFGRLVHKQDEPESDVEETEEA